MRIWLKSALAAIALGFAGGGAAQAEVSTASAGPNAALIGAGVLAVQHHGYDDHRYRDRNRGYRDRGHHRPRGYRYGDRYIPDHSRYRDRPRYRHRGYQRPYRYDQRPYAPAYGHNRCWREDRYSHFRGRPAYVSVRLCRDRYNRVYVQRGSTRLLYYVGGRRHNYGFGHRHRY